MEEAESQQIDENNTQTKDVFTSQTEFVFNGSVSCPTCGNYI